MTSEFLLEAIGQLDDELVLEAASLPKRHAVPWSTLAGLAAALVLCAGLINAPHLLYRNASGTAAPETGGLMDQVQDGAGEYEYAADQESVMREPSADNKSESQATSGSTAGVMAPVFFTQRGIYMLMAPPAQAKLPDNCVSLGELSLSQPDQDIYPSTRTKELVGCPVWESPDGQILYIQLPDGMLLCARLNKYK